MNKSYNDVEVTEEEIASLDFTENPATPEKPSLESEPTTESDNSSNEPSSEEPSSNELNAEVEAKPDSEESSKEVNDTEEEESGVEIDGESYDLDTILQWRDDSANKDSWQKSNTEKAQQLSKWNKLAEKINGDDDFRDHLKDYFYKNPAEADQLLGDVTVIEDPEIKESSDIEKRLEAIEHIESERLQENRVDYLDDQLTTLESQNKELLGEEKTLEFLKFADKNADKYVSDGIPDLNRAFKEWSYDQLNEQLTHYKKLEQNKTRNSGKVVGKSQIGAVEESSPKQYKNFKEVSIDDPEIAKYFE